MKNPLRTLKNFVSDNAGRVRSAARSAVDQLDFINGGGRQRENGRGRQQESGRGHPYDNGGRREEEPRPQQHREPDRTASVEFGRDEERPAQRSGHRSEDQQPRERADSTGNGHWGDDSGQRQTKPHGNALKTPEDREEQSRESPWGQQRPPSESVEEHREESSEEAEFEQEPDETAEFEHESGEEVEFEQESDEAAEFEQKSDEAAEFEQKSDEETGEAIGVLFDRQPRSIRTIEPVGKSGRREQTRHLFVTTGDWDGEHAREDQPDVTLDVSRLTVDELELEVEDLDAQVALQASVGDLVDVKVGANVQLGEVELDLKGVEAEALLEVNLSEIRQILGRALETIENRPELLTKALDSAESAAGEINDTAKTAAQQVGDVGEEAAGQLDDVGEQVTSEAGDVARQATEQAGEAGRKVTKRAGDAGEGTSGPSIQAKSRAEYEPNEPGE